MGSIGREQGPDNTRVRRKATMVFDRAFVRLQPVSLLALSCCAHHDLEVREAPHVPFAVGADHVESVTGSTW